MTTGTTGAGDSGGHGQDARAGNSRDQGRGQGRGQEQSRARARARRRERNQIVPIDPRDPEDVQFVEACVQACFRDRFTLDEITGLGRPGCPAITNLIRSCWTRRSLGFGIHVLCRRFTSAVLVAVLPRYQRQGAASAWINHVEDQARASGRPLVTASCNETNAAALAFLRASGYQAVAVRRDLFQEPPDADGFAPLRDCITLARLASTPAGQAAPDWLPDRARRTLRLGAESAIKKTGEGY